MLLWFLLPALLFVAIDIRNTPESPALKWGFVLLTAHTGVVGAFGTSQGWAASVESQKTSPIGSPRSSSTLHPEQRRG
jgi:hypothetical protein